MDGVGSARFRRHITGIGRDSDQFAGFGVRQQACLELSDEPLRDPAMVVDQDARTLGVWDASEGGIQVAHGRTVISSP